MVAMRLDTTSRMAYAIHMSKTRMIPWGQHLRTTRLKAGLTQKGLAIAVGVDQSVVSRWEHSYPSREQVTKLLAVLPDLAVHDG